MINNLELYGTEDVPTIPRETADKRIQLLKRRLAELMMVHWSNRDNHTINKVLEGITFWTQLRDGETI